MTKTKVLHDYLEHLQNGNIEKVIDLFNEDGIVESPIYGVKKAKQFYTELSNDTSNSRLQLKGVFEQKDSNNYALYFTYIWTIKNGKVVEFDVVDIIEFDDKNKIINLKIIYDTVISRTLINELTT